MAGWTEPQRVALQAESVDSGFAGVHRFALWQDLHADARLVVDESGAVVEAYACDVFGACDVAYADGAVCDGSDACPSRVGNPIRFAGARLLPGSGCPRLGGRDGEGDRIPGRRPDLQGAGCQELKTKAALGPLQLVRRYRDRRSPLWHDPTALRLAPRRRAGAGRNPRDED